MSERNPFTDRIRSHGLSLVEYLLLYELQDGGCAVCGSRTRGPNGQASTTRLTLDHAHSCHPGGRGCRDCVRGLLCDACNRGIGTFGDDPARLRAAAAYLEETPWGRLRRLEVAAGAEGRVEEADVALVRRIRQLLEESAGGG